MQSMVQIQDSHEPIIRDLSSHNLLLEKSQRLRFIGRYQIIIRWYLLGGLSFLRKIINLRIMIQFTGFEY